MGAEHEIGAAGRQAPADVGVGQRLPQEVVQPERRGVHEVNVDAADHLPPLVGKDRIHDAKGVLT
ncbi:MAG: hypothetical protein M3Y91_14690 [Actinomycetota bacterium]|nr:hypothetical protein [Actinomycetota bacterium]